MNLINQILKRRGNYYFSKPNFLSIVLVAAGWMGNYVSLPLFFGVDFLFGSIAVLITIRLYGLFWGTLVALVAGSYTCFLWHHPYALVIFTGEAVFIGLLLRRQSQNLLLLDGIYWLCIGMPLVWLFYGGVMQMPATAVWLILLKQPVNGLFNALIASLLIAHLPLHKWANRPQLNTTFPLRQTLINFLVAFVFFPVLIILVLDSQRVFKLMEKDIQANLSNLSSVITAELQFWSQSHHQILEQLAQVAIESQLESSSALEQSTILVHRSFPDFRNLYIIDRDRQLLFAYPSWVKEEKIAHECKLSGQDSPKFRSLSDRERSNKILELDVPIVVGQTYLGCVVGEIALENLNRLLKATINQQEVQITVVDRNNYVLASTLETRVNTSNFDLRQEGEIRLLSPIVFQQLPNTPNLSAMSRWQKSIYVHQQSLGDNLPWDLILEVPSLPHIKFLQNLYLNHLAIMLSVGCLGIILATILSQRLVRPLKELSLATNDLPHKLWEGVAIDLPSSSVAEIESLTDNFQLMTYTLKQNFSKLKQSKQLLEQRVKERTIELTHAKEAAEASDRAKSIFIAHMSHELRTPLNGILGFTQILQKDPSLDSKQQDSINTIHQCGSHLLDLINDILYLAKSEAGKMELHLTNFNFISFLKDIISIVSLRAEQKGIAFDYQLQSSLPAIVRCDQTRLRQVLLNILGNAVKFTTTGGVIFKVSYGEEWRDGEDGEDRGDRGDRTKISQFPIPNGARSLASYADAGDLTVVASRTHRNPQSPNYKIHFQVEDTGVGIPADELENIFLPFQQAGAYQFAHEGTGLGLAISQNIVQQMGGKIRVSSKPGTGSIFYFELDLPKVIQNHENIKISERRVIGFKGKKHKILVADDQANNRAFLVKVLRPLGFEVREATNGEDCLQQAQQNCPDLILLDLVMPVLDGFETSRRLRKDPNLKEIVIIATSASAFTEDQYLSYQAGCNNFLSKPVNLEQLLEMLEVHLELEWIYEQSSPQTPLIDETVERKVDEDSASSSVVIPSDEELNLLLELAKQGNIARILERAALLEELNAQYFPFARILRQLGESFQERKIREFIEESIEAEEK